jgi:hypothetical protein
LNTPESENLVRDVGKKVEQEASRPKIADEVQIDQNQTSLENYNGTEIQSNEAIIDLSEDKCNS